MFSIVDLRARSRTQVLLLSSIMIVVVIVAVFTYLTSTHRFNSSTSFGATSSPVAFQRYSLNGLTLSVPAGWRSSSEPTGADASGTQSREKSASGSDDDNGPWQLTMTDSDGAGAVALVVSRPLSASSSDQASEAASALLKSSFPGYEVIGSFSFPQGNMGTAVNSVPPTGSYETNSSSSVLRTTFKFHSDTPMEQGICWIVPTAQGYVVIVLLISNDLVAQQLETSILESSR